MWTRPAAIGIGVGLAFAATGAMAHPKLTSASPPVDSTAGPAPKEIRLNFSEGVIVKLSGLELHDESGASVPTGTPVIDAKEKKQLVVPLNSPLAGGRYKVIWHAVSDDTHRVKGEYTFSVAK